MVHVRRHHQVLSAPPFGTVTFATAAASVIALRSDWREPRFAVAFFTAFALSEVLFAAAFFKTWAAWFVVGLLTVTFRVNTRFLVVVGLSPEAASSVASIRNLEGSLAPASHAGARPRPLHIAPDFGARYLAGCGPRT